MKLLQHLRAELMARHYSRRTMKTYVQWVQRFVRFSGMRHPRELGERAGAADTGWQGE